MRRTLLCFGDSNTYGTKPMPKLKTEGRFDMKVRWPRVMLKNLTGSWHLIEEGHPGRTTVHEDPIEGAHRSGERTLLAIIESHRPIDLLIIMLGTNDLKSRFSVGPQDIALGAGRLIDIAQHSTYVKDILLISPPKVLERGCLKEMFQGAQAKSTQLATYMQQVAHSKGVAFIDAATIISSDELDGVHFSHESHIKLGEKIAHSINLSLATI